MKSSMQSIVLAASALLAVCGVAAPADACGGFFCNATQPVNQAAERIVFSENGDGTVTAVIQIQYSGPAEKFAWLLPIPTAPTPEQFKVASDMAFQRLQQATNPQYSLTTMVEGTCRQGAPAGSSFPTSPPTDASAANGDTVTLDEASPVTVEASGSVGPFDWEVISVAEGTEDPAEIAVQWLADHEYAVPQSTAGLVGAYLNEGLFLLAVKLTKTANAGSIRPIVITYAAEQAMIPVKLTSVAANDDMGVMTWLLGEGRGVPQNYLTLELNEARLNWFNASANYNQVISEAADDSGGQGFVTEFAGDTSAFAGQVWFQGEAEQWEVFQTTVFNGLDEMFNVASSYYGGYEGFWDAVEKSVTLSQSVSFADFKLCPSCYADQLDFAPAQLMSALEELVIEPMRVVQDLIDAHPQMTRLYTTLSADEMTVDPLFTFNPELAELSNIHTATRIIECQPDLSQFEAPWRIELPQGDVVRGTAAQVNSQTWPLELASLPPNRQIKRQAASGEGKVLEDNSDKIKAALATYNATLAPAATPDPDQAPVDGEEPGPVMSPAADDGAGDPGASSNDAPTTEVEDDVDSDEDGGGCSVGAPAPRTGYGLVWAALCAAVLARRRRQSH